MNKKKKRQLLILGIILLVLIALFAILKLGGSEMLEGEDTEETVSYEALHIDTQQVTQIGIINGEDTINLEKDGDVWICVDQPDFAVDSSAVELFLENVGVITSETRIEKAEDLSQYGLEEPVLNVTLQWDSNMYTIRIGDYNSMISSYYLSINDETTVYTIDSTLYYQFNKTLEDFELIETEEETETE